MSDDSSPMFASRLDATVLHVDMDAFYASVELLRYPELRGRAVVIGGGRDAQPRLLADGTRSFASLRHYVGRGVVTTSTYEARKLGVFSAMGMMKSAALAPDAVLLPVDFDEYRKYSRAFKAAVRGIAPVVEDLGLRPDDTVAYLCGNPDMILSAEATLLGLGFPEESVKKELYWPKGKEPRGVAGAADAAIAADLAAINADE